MDIKQADSEHVGLLRSLITSLNLIMLKKLEQEFKSSLPFDPHTPEGYRQLCMEYSKIVTPGIEATDRELKRSRAAAHTMIYRQNQLSPDTKLGLLFFLKSNSHLKNLFIIHEIGSNIVQTPQLRELIYLILPLFPSNQKF